MPEQAPAYAASPLGSFPELSQMYATNFSTPVSDAQMYSQSKQDETSVRNSEIAAENARKAAAEAEARQKAFSDPSKYTIQQRSDGGFGFYGPDGKEVTAAQYANNTGQKLTSVLKDSQNPIDIRYVQDQQNLTKYLQAKANSKFDNKQRAIALQIENSVQKAYGLNLAKANPRQLIQAMQYNYPTIYGAHQDNTPGFSGGSTFLPGYGTAQAQAEADNPTGFYAPSSGSGGLSGLKRR